GSAAQSGSTHRQQEQPPQVFSLCAACHPVTADGENGLGPNLRGVLGRRAGSYAGFTYSKAMRNAKIVWSRHELDEYLTNPAAKIPGNMMVFSGLSSSKDREALIGYLAALK